MFQHFTYNAIDTSIPINATTAKRMRVTFDDDHNSQHFSSEKTSSSSHIPPNTFAPPPLQTHAQPTPPMQNITNEHLMCYMMH